MLEARVLKVTEGSFTCLAMPQWPVSPGEWPSYLLSTPYYSLPLLHQSRLLDWESTICLVGTRRLPAAQPACPWMLQQSIECFPWNCPGCYLRSAPLHCVALPEHGLCFTLLCLPPLMLGLYPGLPLLTALLNPKFWLWTQGPSCWQRITFPDTTSLVKL